MHFSRLAEAETEELCVSLRSLISVSFIDDWKLSRFLDRLFLGNGPAVALRLPPATSCKAFGLKLTAASETTRLRIGLVFDSAALNWQTTLRSAAHFHCQKNPRHQHARPAE